MTANQKRNAKAEKLRVIQVSDSTFYVESGDGKICYRVTEDMNSCSCGDWVKYSKSAPDHKCKHILAVMNSIPTGEVENGEILERKKPKLDPRFIVSIEGKDFVKYPGLLDLGHQKGISQIEVEPLQIPSKENGNFAICRATVVSKVGETFIDVGDANPQNCSSKVAKHLLRMASTRSIARALRSFTNIGLTALEELADFNDVIGSGYGKSKPKAKKQPAKKVKAAENTDKVDAETNSRPQKAGGKKSQPDENESDNAGKAESKSEANKGNNSDQPSMSEAQKRAIYNLSRRRGISVEDLEAMSIDAYNVSVENLTSKDASAFIRNLQQAA